MSLLDILILLVAALLLFLLHTPLGWTVILTLIAIALTRILKGEKL